MYKNRSIGVDKIVIKKSIQKQAVREENGQRTDGTNRKQLAKFLIQSNK